MRTVRQGARPRGVHVRKDQNKLSMKCLSSDTRFTLTNQEKEHTELPWVKIMWPTTLRTYPYTVKWVRILHEMCNPSLHISECFNRMRRGRGKLDNVEVMIIFFYTSIWFQRSDTKIGCISTRPGTFPIKGVVIMGWYQKEIIIAANKQTNTIA